MKVSLFALCFMGAALFALSEKSPAAPFAGGFHAQGFQGGRSAGSVAGGHRIFVGRGMRMGSAFRRDNRFFFHRQRFYSASNGVVFGYPGWYPDYYGFYPDTYDSSPDYNDSYPDDYSENGNESYDPGYNYQYWMDLALREQAELARRANYNGLIGPMTSPGRPQPLVPSNLPSNLAALYNSAGGEAQDTTVKRAPNEPAPVQSGPVTLATLPAPQTQGGVFDKLVLVSWLNDAGKDVVFVQNTQTNEVQKITSEPNEHHLRIIEIRPNADPKLFEAVISDGSDQGPVKFRYAPTAVKGLTN